MTINYQFNPSSTAALLDAAMPSTYFRIHSYILGRQQLPDWKLNKVDIANRCKKSLSTVKRAFRWFRDHGYAVWLKNKWHFYPSPRHSLPVTDAPLASAKGFIFDPPKQVIFDPPYKEESLVREKQQPAVVAIPKPEMKKPVVVSVDNEEDSPLVFPVQLNTDQKKACKSIIKKVKTPELAQEILFELAFAIVTGRITSSLPGYLQILVKAANDGTFTRTQVADATKPDNRHIAKTDAKLSEYREHKASKPDIVRGFLSAINVNLRGAKC